MINIICDIILASVWIAFKSDDIGRAIRKN